MTKPIWVVPAAAFSLLAVLMAGADADARGIGGGFRGGGGGFHGHVSAPHGHGYGHRHGFHRHGSDHHRDGRGYGVGGVPWAIGDGYGAGAYYEDGPRVRSEPTYGIPPSPVLPPAIYVIESKAGARASGPVARKGRSNPIVTSGSARGGSSASVIDRRHRMN